jgi:hypothetical protein
VKEKRVFLKKEAINMKGLFISQDAGVEFLILKP